MTVREVAEVSVTNSATLSSLTVFVAEISEKLAPVSTAVCPSTIGFGETLEISGGSGVGVTPSPPHAAA